MLKKTIRMVVAVMIAMVSIFSGVSTAFASGDIIDNSQKASVTIHKYDLSAAEEAGIDTSGYVSTGEPNATAEKTLADYSLKGVEFSYIKVGNILTFTQTEGEQTSIEVVYQIPNKLIDILNLSDPVMIEDSMECFTSDQINSALSNALLQNTETKNKLEDYIKDGTAMPVTDENGMTSASNLDLGLYLFVETKVPENVQYTTDPFFLSLPSTDVDGEEWIYDLTVYPKNQSSYPSIDKFVNEEEGYADYATASEGDTLNYTVVSKLPKITSLATYFTKYEFVDTLCKGITYNKDLSINFYGNFNNAKDNKTDQVIASFTETTDFNVIYGTKADGSTTATISFTAAGLQKLNTTANLSEAYMGIHYTAVVNSNETVVMGHDGNTNDVVLTYSRTNTTEEEHIEDRAYVYVFGIDLTKAFSDNNGDPTKVKFVLNNVSDNYYVQDATGGIVISRTENNWAVNDILNGVVKGNFDNSNGLPKLKPADCQVEVSSDGGNIQPAGLTIDDLITDPQKYLCTLVKLDEVSYDGKGYIVSGKTENKIAFYDKFNVTDQAVWPSLVDITGILFIEGDVPQIAIRSWKDVEDATNLVAPDFFWSSSSYTADFALPEMAEYPILTNSSDGDLTFVSSDTGVATVSSTGEIKLTGIGTTVITATVSETKNYTMATASYELTVISSLATQRVAFVSISTFDNKAYALSNVSTGSGKLKAVPVRLFNGKVLCTSDIDKISWYIEGDKTAILSANGRYLAYNSGVDLSMSDDAYTWIYDKEDLCWTPSDNPERSIAYIADSGSDGIFGAYIDYKTKAEAKLLVEGYVRTATSGKFGTMCLPYGVEATDMSGAVFYEIAGKKVDDNGLPVQLVLSPVEYLQAGKPYLFKAEADEIVLAYSGEPVSVAIGWNGLIGSFDGVGAEASAILEDKYLLSNNKIVKCGKGCTLGTNRAYVDIEQVPVIDYSGVNMLTIQISTPTAVNDVHGMSQTRTDIYNILGQKIYDQVDINDVANKLPSGIYVINGKKVILNK